MKIIICLSLILSTFLAQSTFAQEQSSIAAKHEYYKISFCIYPFSDITREQEKMYTRDRNKKKARKAIVEVEQLCNNIPKNPSEKQMKKWNKKVSAFNRRDYNRVIKAYKGLNLKQKIRANEIFMCSPDTGKRWTAQATFVANHKPEKKTIIFNSLEKLLKEQKWFCSLPRNTKKEMRAFLKADVKIYQKRYRFKKILENSRGF